MYFPYLRGKQYELIAIRELVEKGLIGEKIIPIIEPIKPTSTLLKTLKVFEKNSQMHGLVINPEVGKFISEINKNKKSDDPTAQNLIDRLKSDYLIKAYLMNEDMLKKLKKKDKDVLDKFMIINPKRDCIDNFIKIYDTFEPQYTLIPDDRTFSRKVTNSKVIFMDRFEKAQRNSDYCENEDEFFSEDHLFFENEGFKGFSDYSVVGSEYSESGFAPRAVAIHIVYFDSGNALRVRHFVSDSNGNINDPAGKFGEAVEKLVKWVVDTNPTKTTGLDYFIECSKTGKYPGLGIVKQYSIMHHLELMNKFLEGNR